MSARTYIFLFQVFAVGPIVVLTDLGQLILEGTKMKRALEMAKIAIPHRYQPMSTRVKREMADLVDKREDGERVLMVAEYALKFKKMLQDKRQLDETIIENLIADADNAAIGIVEVGVALKHNCKKKTS